MLNEEVLALLQRSVLCWLSTASADGRPNVSPKEIFAPAPPNTVLIADIASPRSVTNIGVNPFVCIAAVDVFEQRGFQLYGQAELIQADGPRFEETVPPLRAKAGPDFTIRRVISVSIDRVSPIIAPSYWVRPDMDADTRRAGVFATYGVRPV
ncbi:MAG TPA: pyridoxamine 5'-phosphate oxidase family protein [Actinomycetales bacterium]|nr:pyridoxamine 5'-phosphate oxidase family protein [Actinomycetales bacterium]